MNTTSQSPRILNVSWGRVEVEGVGAFKDVKLFPGGAREWDWSETNTHHEPGIQFADVAELLEHGVQTVVLSQGFHERLQVCTETITRLREQGISAHVLQTERAVQRYNELCVTVAVGALIHSTC